MKMRNGMSPDPTVPHNALPDVPPPVDLETKAILKACIAARSAIAELRLAGQLIPDQSVLINTIPLLEAKDSSEIENIVTTHDALFRAASLIDDGDPAAKEGVRYRSALYKGLKSVKSRPLTTRTAIEICSAIKGVDMDVRKTPGTALQNKFTGEIIYTPPEGEELLRNKLSNWESFLNDDSDIDPLIRMAVLHYQFEAIHPFTDGNGRTGRILNILSLIQAGLLEAPTLYLSRYILRTKADYYRLIAAVTYERAWEPWVLYMLKAVEVTAGWTNHRIRAIRALMEQTATHLKVHQPKLHSHELTEIIFERPYVRIADLMERGIARRHAASTYLKQLEAIGILESEKVGTAKVYIHRKYLNLLFADGHEFEPYAELDEPRKARAAAKGRRKRK